MSKVVLTPWFPVGVEPVWPGLYMTRRRYGPNGLYGVGDCWHAMRWDDKARAWFAADSKGQGPHDVIGGDFNNRHTYEWRGILE